MTKTKKKIRKSMTKRIKITAGGKILKLKPGRSHLMEKKSRKRKRTYKSYQEIAKGEAKKIKKELGI